MRWVWDCDGDGCDGDGLSEVRWDKSGGNGVGMGIT